MNQTNFPCGGGGGIPFDCCTPAPCSVWEVSITEYVLLTNCINGFKCPSCVPCQNPSGSGVCENNPGENLSCIGVGGGTYNFFIRQSDCGCPSGLSSGNAHWNPFDPATVPPTDQNPTHGVGGYRYYQRCEKCGCKHWMFWGAHLADASEYVDNIGFSIS